METAPAWLLEKNVDTEMKEAWCGAYIEVPRKEVPIGANVIGSHLVYKVKVEEGSKRLKARLCPHENRDMERGSVRKDSSTAQFDVVRIVLSTNSDVGGGDERVRHRRG